MTQLEIFGRGSLAGGRVDADANPASRIANAFATAQNLHGFYRVLAAEGLGARRDQQLFFSDLRESFSALADGVISELGTAIAKGQPTRTARNRFTLALLMNYLPLSTLLAEKQQTLHAKPISTRFSLIRDTEHLDVTGEGGHSVEQHDLWKLPPNAEETFQDSLITGALVMVDGVIAVPMNGPLAGLCTQTFATPDGTFIEGNWYAPLPETAAAITTAFDHGHTNINLDDQRPWRWQ